MDSLEPGAHLTSPRRGFVHHGVYAGNGKVIHYAGLSRTLRRGPIEEVTLEKFAADRGFSVQPRVAPKYFGDAVVTRARSRLGEDDYRVWSNNCEHFVNWCISGENRSTQIEGLATRVRRIASLARLLRAPRSGGVSSAIEPARDATAA